MMEMVVTTRADKMCKAPGKSYVLQYTRRYSYLLIFCEKDKVVCDDLGMTRMKVCKTCFC